MVHAMKIKQIEIGDMNRQSYVEKVGHNPSGKNRKRDEYEALLCFDRICKGKNNRNFIN